MTQSKLFGRSAGRMILSALAAVVITIGAGKYALVSVVKPVAQSTADRAICSAFFGNTPLNEVAEADPFCASVLSHE